MGRNDETGTPQTNYHSARFGPAECRTCIHMKRPDRCDHPEVIADPEVRGKVEPLGWCKFHNLGSGERGIRHLVKRS